MSTIKTWQERIVGDNRTWAVEAGMKAEIAELRAALAASGGNAALTHEQIKGICITAEHAGVEEGMRVAKSYLAAASAPNAALVAACTEGAEVNLPDFMDWIADRLEFVYGESPNVDFVRTCRDRAKKVRAALSAAGQEVDHG